MINPQSFNIGVGIQQDNQMQPKDQQQTSMQHQQLHGQQPLPQQQSPLHQPQSQLQSPLHQSQPQLQSPIHQSQSQLQSPLHQSPLHQSPLHQPQSQLQSPLHQPQHQSPLHQSQLPQRQQPQPSPQVQSEHQAQLQQKQLQQQQARQQQQQQSQQQQQQMQSQQQQSMQQQQSQQPIQQQQQQPQTPQQPQTISTHNQQQAVGGIQASPTIGTQNVVGARLSGSSETLPTATQQSPTTRPSVTQPAPTGPPPPPPPSQPAAANQFNTASLCKLGQETVHDIVAKVQEMFQILKNLQPPNGTPASANISNDKRLKIQEQLKNIKLLFKKVRIIYEKCNDSSQLQGMEYMHIESLIPLKEEWDVKSEERKTSETYRLALDENKELIEQVQMKNTQLKEIIDNLRRIIWEINTMLAMRKS